MSQAARSIRLRDHLIKIDKRDLLSLLHGMTTNALLLHDQLVTDWVYRYFGIPFDLDPSNLSRFSPRIWMERHKASKARAGLLSWASDTEYQDLVKESRRLVDELGAIVGEATVMIGELRASS